MLPACVVGTLCGGVCSMNVLHMSQACPSPQPTWPASHRITVLVPPVQIAGVTIDGKGGNKDAVLVLVAAETERQMSWSRLESLIMHWAVSAVRPHCLRRYILQGHCSACCLSVCCASVPMCTDVY